MKSVIMLSIAFAILLLSPMQSGADYPHHLYMGIWAGADSGNPSGGGGWDNDNSYSVDRAMVGWQNKNFALEETFQSADDVFYDGVSIRAQITYQELENIWYYGRVPVVNLNFYSHTYVDSRTPHCVKSMVELDTDLSNTNSDAYKGLVKWAQGVKMWFDLRLSETDNFNNPNRPNPWPQNRFLYLAFMYEPNFSFCATEGDPATWAHVDPVAFKSVFRKGRAIVESTVGAGYAGSINWLFAPANESMNFMPGLEEYYPGDDVVDWMGLSAYNFGGYVKQGFTYPWQYFRDFAAPYLDRLRALAPDKPLALLQTGGISYGGDKNAWIIDFLNEASQYPKLYMLIYFNDVVEWEAGYQPGFDWPVFWNDAYSSISPNPTVNLSNMRYTGWLTALQNNSLLKFSPVFPMPGANKFVSSNWDIPGQVAPISNTYNLFPELRDKNGDADGDGVYNLDELAAGLDPLVYDVQSSETNCNDGVDNDANGRIDRDDTVFCGDIPLAENSPLSDSGRLNEDRYFQFNVPGGSSRVTVSVQNITGTVRLYLKKSGRPTTQSYDYEMAQSGGNITLPVNSPAAGLWHVLVHVLNPAEYSLVVNNLILTAPMLSNVAGSVVCDIDGNGQDDMIFSVTNYGVQVYTNNSTWLNLSVDGTNPSRMLCNDVHGDGKKRVVGVWNTQGVMKYFDTASWSWIAMTTPGSLPDVMRSADMNGDGREDLAGVFRSTGSLQYRSSASGLWNTVPLGGNPDDFFVANMDAIADNELVGVFRAIQMIKIYNGGAWSNVSLPPAQTGMPDSVTLGDIDNDGIGDIVAVWRTTSPHKMYVRSGYNGQWRELETTDSTTPDSKPSRIFIGDVDGDKKDDIISAWDAWKQIQIFRQIWFGWMDPSDPRYDPDQVLLQEFSQGLPPTILVGDFDGDTAGRKDVAMIWNDRLLIWMNNAEVAGVDVSAPAFTADFTATPVSGSGPLCVSFTDLSNNGPTSWLWDFGDGTFSAERNPRHNYKNAGTFSVTLTATGSGVSPSVTKNSYVSVSQCGYDPFRIGGVYADYPNVQSAYNATYNGGTLEIQALDFVGGLDDIDKSITLRGGFGCDFYINPDHTVIEGSIVIDAGALTIENITLK